MLALGDCLPLVMEYDNLHWDFREIDGYNRPFNSVISEREAGKTTALWHKGRLLFEKGATFILTRQQKVSITDVYLHDCENVINKFIDDPEKRFRFLFNKGALDSGIVDVRAQVGKGEPRLMFRCIALSNQLSDMKSLMLPNCACHFGDEFIKDVRSGEKYLPREAWKYNELINTFQREAPNRNFKSYLFGNPYSRANPYFVQWGVDISKLKRGTIWTNAQCVVQCYEIKPELREFIKANNPLYQFDNAYTRYAFDGLAINDSNMILKEKQPQGFQLFCVVIIEGNKIGLYSSYVTSVDYVFWVGPVKDLSRTRVAYAFDFSDLQQGCVLIDAYGKNLLSRFAAAMAVRKVAFANSQYGYWAEQVYNFI